MAEPALKSVDELFPAKSVDELFPASVERENYRQKTLGTSPIQDLIFGDTSVNPVARVLDAFGQGAKQGWGAEPLGISKESEEALKKMGIFNDYDKGQKSIIKAANESLFRGAASYLVEPIMRGLPAAFGGIQAATAQIGTEAGQEKLGREAAGAFEAFPAGLRAPTGIPHAAPHPMLGEIERARSLGVIGAGEEGYFGTKPAEVAPPISRPNEAPRAAELPVEKPVEAVKAEAEPAPTIAPAAEAAGSPVDESHPIAQDVARRLQHAGRPPEEATAAGQVVASHYEARAARFGGELGTADEMYQAEGARIRGPNGEMPEPVPPPPVKVVLPGTEGKPVNPNQSLLDFLAREGGLKPTADLKQIFGDKNPTIPGAGKLFRNDGLTLDEALTRAKENSFVLDPNDIQHTSGIENRGALTKSVNDLQDMIAEEAGGNKQYRNTRSVEPAKVNADEEFRHISDELSRQVEESGGDPRDIDAATEKRVVEMIQKGEAPDVMTAYERAIMEVEYNQKTAKSLDEVAKSWDGKGISHAVHENGDTITVSKIVVPEGARGTGIGSAAMRELTDYADANGKRIVLSPSADFGGTKSRLVDFYKELGFVENKGRAKDFTTRETMIREPQEPGTFDQITRGKFRTVPGGKPIITLFKDANASTFIHETGHHWLEELMKDSEHPKAPEGLRSDADAVLRWLKVDTYHDIKVRHHEQFARGFERYMMEGKAPSQGLARVFEQFKNWLTRIYQTVDRLKSPINDEIRGVFDRLLTMKKENVKIEPDAPPKTFADIHETDALHTPPEAAHPVAETIQAERDMLANEHIPEGHDARLEGVTSEAQRREAGGPQPLRDGNEAGLGAKEAGNAEAPGAVGEGGSDAAPESARPSIGGGKTEAPLGPQDTFKGPDSPLVDKAGNIRLDTLGTAEDVSKAIRDAAAENNEFIDARRGVITDGQVLELADALGMDANQINQRKLGQAYNAEQVMAARKLLIQSATTVRDAMVRAAAGAEVDIMAYAEAKARHQMIQEQVAGITAEAGRALRAFRKLEGQQEAGQINDFLKDATGKTLFQLQREAQLGLQLETPAQVSKFVNDSSKPTWKDMVIEAWISALLSGPKTHVANIMGNTISGLWRPVETAGAAVVGKVLGSAERVTIGEAKAELFGMVQGAREGVIAAAKAFKSEEPQLTSAIQTEKNYPKALPSATVNLFGKEMEIGGKQARIPLRLLGAEDEFFKSVAFRGDINRQAYAIASKENLPPEQFNARVAELSMSPTEEMMGKAKDVADYQTFQTPLGKVGRSVQTLANSHMAVKFIIPFVRTPLNLLKYASERTPLGLFSAEVRDNLAGKNGTVASDTQVSRIALGTAVGVATYGLATQGLITGGGPADKNKRAIMQANGWQDYSIRIGDMYYRYNRLDPFSVILGVVADAYEIYNASGASHPDKEKIPSLVFAAVTQNILNRASLQGISDAIQAVTDHERYGRNYIKKMAGTIVPAFSAQTAQALDPVVREARTVLDGIKSRIPGLSQTLLPKRDVWGEPMVREGGLGPDIAAPIIESRVKNDPVNKALLSANYFPGHLQRKIRGVELTDEQYDDYARIAGRTAKMRLNAIVSMPGFEQIPETARQEMMTKTITHAREMAQSIVIMQSVNSDNDIMKRAAEVKRVKKLGEPAH
jgi:GNAT superfamily N-acetyltransferase